MAARRRDVPRVGVVTDSTACLPDELVAALGALAAGRVDLVVEADLKSYDIVALIPIIEAAGGVITGPDGRQPLEGGTVVAAATPELAEQAWAVLQP